jgi:hypothetical protein
VKLEVTRRARNARSRRVEAWEAATPCGTYTASRLEHEDTPWALYRHAPTREELGLFGSLRAAQRHVDRIEPQNPTEDART